MKHNWKQMVLMAGLVTTAVIGASAQTSPPPATPPVPRQRMDNRDPISQLNLSADQREQIRLIREQNREERATVTQRLRESNRALQEVLEKDNPDEALVEQRLKEVAAAQADVMRLRILSEVKIRRVLTQEQRVLVKAMRAQVSTRREERRIGNLEQRQRRLEDRSLRMRERRRMRGPGARPIQPRPIL
jgi:Spy/CpxP family protein refolding chaperone